MPTHIHRTSELAVLGPLHLEWGGGKETRVHIDTPDPSKVQLLQNFVRSGVRHVSASMPKASDADVAARWDICKSAVCGLFRLQSAGKGYCAHPQCGCNLRALGNESAVTPNKLRWADEKCPAGLWQPVQPVASSEQRNSIDK